MVLANIDALHGRDSLWCVPGQQAGRYLPTSTPCTAGDPGIATSGNRPGFALVSVRSTSRALPANVNALHAGLRSCECQVHRPGATCQRQCLAWPGFALVRARSTGRALPASVKTSNRPAVNVLGIVTSGNRLGFAVVRAKSTGQVLPASVNALHGRDSPW